MIKSFSHTGISVKDLDKAIDQYEKLGFSVIRKYERPDMKARAAMLEHPDSGCIELWHWQDASIPQVEFIKNHLAFISDDLDSDVKALVEQGCEVVIPRTKGAVFNYFFVRDPSGNYIEIAAEKEA